jgi:hypothetical protein
VGEYKQCSSSSPPPTPIPHLSVAKNRRCNGTPSRRRSVEGVYINSGALAGGGRLANKHQYIIGGDDEDEDTSDQGEEQHSWRTSRR